MLKNKIMLDPLFKRRLAHFKTITRAQISLKLLIIFTIFSLCAELFINNKPLILYYNRRLFLPLFRTIILGTELGLPNQSEVHYRDLAQHIKQTGNGWIIMPVIPYNAIEQDLDNYIMEDAPGRHTYIGIAIKKEKQESLNPEDYQWVALQHIADMLVPFNDGNITKYIAFRFADNTSGPVRLQFNEKTKYIAAYFVDENNDKASYDWQKINTSTGIKVSHNELYVWIKFADTAKGLLLPPYKPSFKTRHILGTDRIGRDVLARLIYGFRTTLIFVLIFNIVTYCIGIGLGFIMGYKGGKFDLLFQRLIEIWELIPFIYVVMIISSIFKPNFIVFVIVFTLFGWTKKTWMIRVLTYREKESGYVQAARCFGSSTPRIFFRHILPNLLPAILTSLPFSINTSISAITALDYLGFGLPPPIPSWGELLATGTSVFLTAPWILLSVLTALIAVLIMITFIGEGLRESFDPKHFTIYQ